MRAHALLITMALAAALLIPPTEHVFAHSSAGSSAAGVAGVQTHQSKNCDTQATEQKLAGDDRRAFMQACMSHQATGNTGVPDQTITTPTSGSDATPPMETQNK